MPRSVEGYMCQIDFDEELGHAMDGTKVYSSIDDLKDDHKCWRGCGIVKVNVTYVETVHKAEDESDGEE